MSILNVHDPLQVPLFPINPIPNGQVFIFVRNTETYVPLYQDPDLTVSRANPVDGDANGNFPPIYVVDGIYKLVVRDQSGKLIATQQQVVVNHVSRNVAGQRDFLTYDDLLANSALSYTTSDPYALVVVGELLRVSDTTYAYEVAEADATDHHIATAGGIKLYERHIFSSRARFVDAVSRGWTMPLGHTQTVDGRQYTYVGPGYADGPADLPGWMPVEPVTPEHFANDLSIDATAPFNAALQFAAAFDVPGRSAGAYLISGTLTPGGPYRWDWSNTELVWTGGQTLTALTEVMFNPLGSTTPQPSGKYVLFDTKNCTGATNAGLLTLRGVGPGNMSSANRGLIPPNLVAITASESGSADMIWEGLSILGCGHGLWQGDQRGSAPNILPYTRWSVRYLKIQFCLEAINGGMSGNAFDDGNWSNVRLTRNADNGTLRTDFVGNSIFLNGMVFNNDSEPQRIATTAGSTTATLTAHSPYVTAGTVICIQNANQNLSGSNTIPLVTRIAARSGNQITLETPADRTVTGARFIVNPPSFRLFNAALIAQHLYVEQCHNAPIELQDHSVVETQSLKVSDGVIAARYNTPILVTGFRDTAILAVLHDRSVNSDEIKGIVGVSNLTDGAGTEGGGLVELTVQAGRDVWVNSQPARVIDLETDHLGVLVNNTACAGNGYNVAMRCTDGHVQYMVGQPGTRQAYRTGAQGGFEVGANLRGAEDMTGIAATGQCGAAAGGVAAKTPGGTGEWYAPVTLTPGARMRVDVTVDAQTAGTCMLTLYDSAGAGAGTPVAGFEQVRGPGRKVIFFDVPAGGDADRVGFACSDACDIALSRFVVQRVLSV
jgi:hypothetical protein